MITINDKTYFVEIPTILNDLGINVENTSGNNYMCCCPYHDESNPSFGINKEGVFNCFGCGVTGNILNLIMDSFSYDTLAALKYLDKYSAFNYDERPTPSISPRVIEKEISHKNITNWINYRVNAMEYLESRNISFDTINKFDIGEYNDCVVFPIKDMKGNIISVQMRKLFKKQFIFEKGFNMSNYIFGLYELIEYGDPTKPVYVTESIIDCLTVWSYGGQAISLFSAGLSNTQGYLLSQTPFRIIKDGMDNDTRGRMGWNQVKNRLAPRGFRFIESKHIEGKKDINELTLEEFNRL